MVRRAILVAFFVVVFGSAQAIRGEEPGSVAADLEKLKQRVAVQDQRLGAQAKEIQALRQELKRRPATAGAGEDVAAIVRDILESQRTDKKKGLFSGGVPSLKGEWWKLGGKMEFEFLDTETDRSGLDTATTSARERGGASSFQLDKVVLKPEIFINDDITLVAVIEFAGQSDGKENSVNVDEAYLKWNNFLEYLFIPEGRDPTNTYIMVGDFNYFEKTWKPGKRKTENYDLVTSTFFRDDDLGIRVGGGTDCHPLLKPFWYFQLSNGNRIDDRSIQDRSGAFEMLVYDENNLDFNNNKMLRGGLGNSMDLDKFGNLDLLFWGSTEDLDPANDIFGGKIGKTAGFLATYPTPDLNADIYGLITSYRLGDFQLVTQFAHGPISDLDIDTFEVRPSYKIHLPGIVRGGRKFFTSLELVYSYSFYQLKNLPSMPSDARTWDREKQIFAALFEVTKNVKFKIEYSDNDESTGAGSAKNDEFIAHLQIAW